LIRRKATAVWRGSHGQVVFLTVGILVRSASLARLAGRVQGNSAAGLPRVWRCLLGRGQQARV